MKETLVSLQCHPDREPAIEVPIRKFGHYEVYVNRTPNYGDAIKSAMDEAIKRGMDLVVADSDGYHPVDEIIKLAMVDFYPKDYTLLKPYRENIGIQSRLFSYLYSLLHFRRFKDTTGGFYRMSVGFMQVALPHLQANDMTIHLEILEAAMMMDAKIFQYGYIAGENDVANSKRTKNFQWKLLKHAFVGRFL